MRKQYLEELLTRVRWQNIFIFNDDYEKFIEIIEEKQQFINKIQEINKKEFVPWNNEERVILEELQRLDEENTDEFIRQMEETREDLKKLNLLMIGHEQYINPYGQMMGVGINFDGGKR